MTALPLPRPRLLTSAEFAALPEMEGRYELQEGIVMMSPSPAWKHQILAKRLCTALDERIPRGLHTIPAVDIDLELVARSRPGFVREPDVAVVTSEGLDRVDDEGGIIRARDVLLVVEILSPGSVRIDTRIKHDEYAEAGIPHYWMIDLDGGPSLTACHLAGEFGYADTGPVTGVFTAESPFAVRIDLDALVRR